VRLLGGYTVVSCIEDCPASNGIHLRRPQELYPPILFDTDEVIRSR